MGHIPELQATLEEAVGGGVKLVEKWRFEFSVTAEREGGLGDEDVTG